MDYTTRFGSFTPMPFRKLPPAPRPPSSKVAITSFLDNSNKSIYVQQIEELLLGSNWWSLMFMEIAKRKQSKSHKFKQILMLIRNRFDNNNISLCNGMCIS